jgi:hypothetical protein
MLIETIDALLNSLPGILGDKTLHDRAAARIQLHTSAPHEDKPGIYRASSIGKPWIIQVLDRWYSRGEKQFTLDQQFKMLEGIVAQAWIEVVFDLSRLSFTSEEVHLRKVGGCQMEGHSDIILTSPKELLVLEVKSMDSHVMKSFISAPNDNFGYLSQLAFYTGCVAEANPAKKVGGAFLLCDRSRAKFTLLPIMSDNLKLRWDRIHSALETVDSIPQFNIEALLETVIIPPTVNGKLPGGMNFTRWCDALYIPEGAREYRVATNLEAARLIKGMTKKD